MLWATPQQNLVQLKFVFEFFLSRDSIGLAFGEMAPRLKKERWYFLTCPKYVLGPLKANTIYTLNILV